MSANNQPRQPGVRPRSITAYLIAFFSLSALLFVLTAWWMLYKMDEIRQVASDTTHQIAREEINEAIEVVRSTARTHAYDLASWDETYQQFADPTFYLYWRSNRALQSGLLPGYIVDVELYDSNGRPLQENGHLAAMPERLPDVDLELAKESGTDMLYVFTPVLDKRDNRIVIGHAAIKLDFIAALQTLNRFNRVDFNSITSILPEGERIDAGQIEQILVFDVRGLAETEQLERLMQQTLTRFAILAALMLLAAYLLASHLIHKPLHRLIFHIKTLSKSNIGSPHNGLSSTLHLKELESLRVAINDYQDQLDEMHSNLDQKNRELWQLAHNDPLTGIANRRAYEDDWKQLMQVVSGQRIPISVMLIDCDHFKAINDTYGHETGDRVIHSVAQCLSRALRKNDRLYRIGGDEFAMHLINTTLVAAEALAIRCQTNLAEFDFKQFGIKEPVRFSIGIANAYGDDSNALFQLHRKADVAMYQAKAPGRRKVICFEEGMGSSSALLSNRYVNAVYQAVESGAGLVMYFQPIVAVNSKVNGFYEVLTRLKDDEGLITPANIFPVIAAEGLEAEFDFRLIDLLADKLAGGMIPEKTSLSFNMDGTTLMSSEVIEHLEELSAHLDRNSIIIEITETALIADLHEARKRLDYIRTMGFRVALDDFGSGYSSLRYLSNMPVDIIKFDINMTRDLLGSGGQRIIAEDIANMVLKAGYELIAEGIETRELLKKVQNIGFTYVQGYLLGRPAESVDKRVTLALEHFDLPK